MESSILRRIFTVKYTEVAWNILAVLSSVNVLHSRVLLHVVQPPHRYRYVRCNGKTIKLHEGVFSLFSRS